MLVLSVVLVAVTLSAAVLTARAARRLPERACPECRHETWWVRRGALRPLSRLLQWRWCPRCGWSGLSLRRGIAAVGSDPAVGVSFRWGKRRARPAQGGAFRWKAEAERAVPSVDGAPAHPSGFRWGAPGD